MSQKTDLQTQLNRQAALIEELQVKSLNGGVMQIATGTFTPTSIDANASPITVNGLSFKPKFVLIMLGEQSGSLNQNRSCLGAIVGGLMEWSVMMTRSTSTSYSGVSLLGRAISNISGYMYQLVINDDGFTVTSTSGYYEFALNKEYKYIAIG